MKTLQLKQKKEISYCNIISGYKDQPTKTLDQMEYFRFQF